MNAKKRRTVRIVLFLMIGIILLNAVITERERREAKNTYESVELLPGHGLDFSLLDRTDDKYAYEDENYTSSFGIDISEHQGPIDFQRVRNDGVEFVFIRVGFRGQTQGLLYEDSRFEEYYRGARNAGLQVGFYFYSQAISRKEAVEEAEFVLERIRDKVFELPVVYDYEDAPNSRINDLSGEQRTENFIAFAERIRRNNYPYMLYTNMNWLRNYYDVLDIIDYDIWYAQYYPVPEYPYPFRIWQYSETGEIDGISKPVDLNIMFLKKDSD